MFNQQSKDAQTVILANLNTAIMVVDEQLCVRFLNAAAEALFGISADKANQLKLATIAVNHSQTLVDILQQCQASERAYAYREVALCMQAGQTLTVDCSISPIFDLDSGYATLIEINRVDRVLKIAREDHIRQQHITAREIARGLAHEINNPLGGLRGAAQLLEKALPDNSLFEYTQVIIQEADRLQNLMSRMLGPNVRPNKAQTNVHEILRHVIHLVDAESDQTVRFVEDYDPSIPELYVDKEQLIQAILNIVRNAMQALTDSGCITLKTRVLNSYTIGRHFYDLVAKIDIIDNGPGVPADLIDRIFYPMVTGRSEGSGLGLSIAQSLINLHNGLIECSSQAGHTCFSILLPMDTIHRPVI